MFNRIFAFIWIVLLSPLFLFGIVGILISDFGPIFYKATRAGRKGDFKIIKFRSMRVQKKSSDSKITGKNDSRVFLFGKIIRLTKIDELPQLFNILKGEMNFVGPRPEDVDIVNEFYDDIMLESLLVNPGLASPGSVYNYTHVEDNLNVDDVEEYYTKEVLPIKIRMDVVYVRNKSVLYDFRIIFKTLKVIGQKVLGKKEFDLPEEYFAAQKLL